MLKSYLQLKPLSAIFTKRSNTFKQFVGKVPTYCLSVFDHFEGLALKGLNYISPVSQSFLVLNLENCRQNSFKFTETYFEPC